MGNSIEAQSTNSTEVQAMIKKLIGVVMFNQIKAEDHQHALEKLDPISKKKATA